MTAWFTERDLRAAAGDTSFARGREYVAAVGDVQPTALGVSACVRGGDSYRVWLGRDGERLVGECECPFGADGNFCKHCVAVGLVLLDEGAPGSAEPDLASYLRTLDHAELVELLLAQAERDTTLYRRLTLRAVGTTGAPQVAVLRRRVEDALRVRGRLDRQATTDYVRRAGDVLDTVTELVESGHPAEARPLARSAVEGVTAAMPLMDEVTGAVVTVCRRAFSLYARVCTAARPNPAKLAAWIFRTRMEGPGWPALELAEFAEALGRVGLEEYRALVDRARQEADPERALVVRAMREQLAALDGDLDGHVDILAEDVPDPKAFLAITALLREAGQLAGAIRWAERGLEETGDPRLADTLIRSYVDAGRPEQALAVRQAALRDAPTRLTYANLRSTAEATGAWPAAREAALDLLHAAAESGDASELVGALLDEGEVTEAWRVAEKHGCADRAWLEVAREHGATNPAEVVAGYRRIVENCLRRTGREAYREIGLLLEELRDLSARCGAEAEFDALLADIRDRYRRRSSLLGELHRRGL
ncbi:SWIM zinc finger family protein [Actinophytocola xanthii]|uniref:SWIM-type domain-containing protein n=1 Tax=Actinophytocola xanthii TaxID=1912961 RepID=A0A1Q8CNX7_9PSEU|nr:DUF6880 family protein [Actinophytocola xanthii]OLF16069.1 hypothetical protein BU204_18075 [Actinophytocola xanthii]